MDNSVYQNPLITRYASKAMAENFSDDKRFKLWRKLWIALAESEMELGLNITKAQLDEMKKYAEQINFELAENTKRKSVMTLWRTSRRSARRLFRQSRLFTSARQAALSTAIRS